MPLRPRYAVSVSLMLRYLEWSCGLYRALQEHGMSRAQAAAIVEAIMVEVYGPVPKTMFGLSRFRSGRPATRVTLLLGVFTRHVFPAPPFRYRHLRSKRGVAFDVTRCPLAAYCKDQGVPELTAHAACNLDHCAARAFGVELRRSQTIAEGGEFCDFRWEFPEEWNGIARHEVG